MTVLTKKSILARLLARENITVEQTNHNTAFFDVENRVLGIPYWKDIGKDLYDLFVGHEIGHALHTPADGWHSSTTEIPGCPRSYINIVEDIRIEKLVLREYPGLLGNFMRGYKDLLDRDFFGIQDVDVDTLSFMNRLNIFSKSRGLVEVGFSSKEQPFVDRAMAVETWEDVMNSCREIYAFMQEELDLQKSPKPESDPIKIAIDWPSAGGKSDAEDSDKEVDIDLRSKKNKSNSDTDTDASKDKSEGSPETSDTELDSTGGSDNIDVVETDAMFRDAVAKSLIDSVASGGSNLFIKGPTKAQAMAATTSYEELRKSRTRKLTDINYPIKQYTKWLAKTNSIVSIMVQEFEMRKTARRFARARQSTKGSLDVSQLYKYKYDDTIFKQVTQFDDDQSHGLVMLVDYSGSMHGIMPKVLEQILILSMFCKRTNIPFEVYGFTNPTYRCKAIPTQSLTSLNISRTHVFKLIDSSMTKTVYEEAFKMLFPQTIGANKRLYWAGEYEAMAGTPLASSIAVMYHHIAAFKAKFNVQKMNFVTLTDGESDHLGIIGGIDLPRGFSTGKVNKVVEIMGQKIKLKNTGYGSGTEEFLNGLRNMGVRTMNYHFVSQNSLAWRMRDLAVTDYEKVIDKAKKEGCLAVDNKNGYDRQIFTVLKVVENTKASSSTADTESEDLEESDSQEFTEAVEGFANSFTQKAFTKKRNRLIALKFAETLS